MARKYNMEYGEACEILGLVPFECDHGELIRAWRAAADEDPDNIGIYDEAYLVILEVIRNGNQVPEHETQPEPATQIYTADARCTQTAVQSNPYGQYAGYAAEAVSSGIAGYADAYRDMKQYHATLDADVPEGADSGYKQIREFVQHFPYRLVFFAICFAIVGWHMALVDSWEASIMSTLIATLAAILGTVNLIYPIITKPLRYKLIEMVDEKYA